MERYVFDVELYINYFEVGFKEFGTDHFLFFELSEYHNDIDKLKRFLSKEHILISFNGIHYDNLILTKILEYQNEDVLMFLRKVKELSDNIISDNYEQIKYYKYNKGFKSLDVDLYLYWSKMLRLSKKLSLKGLMVQLNMPLIQELPYKPDDVLTRQQMSKVKQYNINDLDGTEQLCKRLESDIKLRFSINQERGFNCFSWDAIKLASEELLKSYCDTTQHDVKEIRNLKFNKSEINIKDLLSDIHFNFKTETFKNLLNHLNSSINTFSKKVFFNCKNTNILLSYGVGGIHSVNKNQTFKTTKDKQLLTSDVASLYPTIIENYKLIRFKEVLQRYSNIKKERILAKHGKLEGKNNNLYNKFYKLVLNGVSGLLDNTYSWLYYPEGAMKLRLMGQLILTKLIEEAALAGFEVVSANTKSIGVIK